MGTLWANATGSGVRKQLVNAGENLIFLLDRVIIDRSDDFHANDDDLAVDSSRDFAQRFNYSFVLQLAKWRDHLRIKIIRVSPDLSGRPNALTIKDAVENWPGVGEDMDVRHSFDFQQLLSIRRWRMT